MINETESGSLICIRQQHQQCPYHDVGSTFTDLVSWHGYIHSHLCSTINGVLVVLNSPSDINYYFILNNVLKESISPFLSSQNGGTRDVNTM